MDVSIDGSNVDTTDESKINSNPATVSIDRNNGGSDDASDIGIKSAEELAVDSLKCESRIDTESGSKVESESNAEAKDGPKTQPTDHLEPGLQKDPKVSNDNTNDIPEGGAREDAAGDETTSVDSNDPYFYLKRNEFTSEIFKIELSNLPQKFGFGQLKKKLTNLNLKPNKIKAIPYKTFAYITFRCEKDREDAMTALEGHVWRGSSLKVKKANPTADPLQKKRRENQDQGDASSNKRARVEEDDVPWNIRLKNSVTPLWDKEYPEQLKIKTEIIEDILKKLERQFQSQCPDLKPWLKQQRSLHNGRCCELLPFIESPVLTGYRNKCEFTLGKSPDGEEKTLGFRLGKYSGGTSSVGEPYDVSLISPKMAKIVKVFQDYFRSSKYDAFSPETHLGNWRQLAVRESRGGDIMTFPEFHPQNLTKEEIDAEIEVLKTYFTTGDGKDSGITSMFFSVSSERISGTASAPMQHVFGEKYITEDLLGMKFRISPDAFFQVNTLAAEVLYNKVADWCNVSPATTVLDICCGTGTIGLTLAKRVGKVIGIEMCQPAVEDARENAKLNDVKNVEYFCGKAEDVITGVSMRLDRNEEVVAIVDPPRAGLHPKVVKTLRRCFRLEKVIYVSCSPQSAMQNFIDLCRPESKKVRGAPYRLVRAIPVDLFPQTKLCELILQFERNLSGETKNDDSVG